MTTVSKNDPKSLISFPTIREACPEDLELLSALERKSQIHPWPPQLFQGELDNPFSHIYLLLAKDKALGYVCCHFLLGEVSIINLATSPSHRRCGIASRLLSHVLISRKNHAVERAFLEVRASNQAALSLYRAFGFKEVGCRKRYYSDGEDALLMEWAPNPVIS